MKKQIKTRLRVTTFGEVYTAEREVNAMIDLVNDRVKELSSTILEPACGNGNFLIEILRRRLEIIKSLHTTDMQMTYALLTGVSSLYGIDIQKDNVLECRVRLLNEITKTLDITDDIKDLLTVILKKNIIAGDTLTMKAANGKDMQICEWDVRNDGHLICKTVLYKDMVANGGESTAYKNRYAYRWLPSVERITA